MSPSEKHPHIENAADEQILELLDDRTPEIRDIYLAVHRLVREILPDVTYATDCTDGETGYGAHQYGYDGWGMAGLIAYGKWVSLAFLRGTDIEDAAGLFEGGGKQIRHVKLRTIENFEQRRDALRVLLEQAASLGRR